MKNDNTVFCLYEAEPERQRRTDALMAQKIDVAIIFQEMLGTFAAAKYLSEQQVPLQIALRVLVHSRRNSPSPPKMIGCEEPPAHRSPAEHGSKIKARHCPRPPHTPARSHSEMVVHLGGLRYAAHLPEGRLC